jgi:hypothetical protein
MKTRMTLSALMLALTSFATTAASNTVPDFPYTREPVVSSSQTVNTSIMAMLLKVPGGDKNVLDSVRSLSDVFSDLEKLGFTVPLVFAKPESGTMPITGEKTTLSGEQLFEVLKSHGTVDVMLKYSADSLVGAPTPMTVESMEKGEVNGTQFHSNIVTLLDSNGQKVVDYMMAGKDANYSFSGNSRLRLGQQSSIIEIHNTDSGILFILTNVTTISD